MSHPQLPTAHASDMLNKVPEVTLIFWVIKIMATTVGETFGAELRGANFGRRQAVVRLIVSGRIFGCR
jgi:uncharacterized membrane-anchored protein